MSDLMQVSKALKLLLSEFTPVGSETINLEQAAFRVLSTNVDAKIELPLFDNSSMDGFAVKSSDTIHAQINNPVCLNVVADIPAGFDPINDVDKGQAARIVTGAMLPNGSDVVVPVEDTNIIRFEPGSEIPDSVCIYRGFKKGENIRPRGQDIRRGENILVSGNRLRPQDLGILAAQGIASVNAYRRPKIGIFSSGNELIKPGSTVYPGQKYDSNSYTLTAQIQGSGCEFVNFGTYGDSAHDIKSAFEQILNEGVDLIISSAGVSMGAFDFVRSFIEQEGKLKLWRVNMRPGKPLVFGEYKTIPFIGLPGNPVSAFIGFEVFIKPVLNLLSGISHFERDILRVQVSHSIESDGRESYLRGNISKLNGKWIGSITEHQGSGNIMSLVKANAIIVIPLGVTTIPANSMVDSWYLTP